MRVAVTGGTGRLGSVLVRGLIERGHTVRALVAPGDPMAFTLEGLPAEQVSGSVLDADSLAELARGAEVLFHLAAKVDLGRDRDGSIAAVNVEGTRAVVAAARAQGARLVHCSSHHALVRHPLEEPLDERRPLALAEKCDYHRAKAHAEQLVLDAVAAGLDAVITSPGTLLGPFDFAPSLMGGALLDLYHGRIPVLMEVVSDYVDARDVADGMIAAATRGRRGERYLLSGEVLRMPELAALFAETTGRPVPRRCLPLWTGWAMLPFATLHAVFTGRPPVFTAGVLRASVSNRAVCHDKASRELDFRPRPIATSLHDTMAWYGAQGWLDAWPPAREAG